MKISDNECRPNYCNKYLYKKTILHTKGSDHASSRHFISVSIMNNPFIKITNMKTAIIGFLERAMDAKHLKEKYCEDNKI